MMKIARVRKGSPPRRRRSMECNRVAGLSSRDRSSTSRATFFHVRLRDYSITSFTSSLFYASESISINCNSKIGLTIFSEQLYLTLCNIHSGHFYNSMRHLFCNHTQLFTVFTQESYANLCSSYLHFCNFMHYVPTCLCRNLMQIYAILIYHIYATLRNSYLGMLCYSKILTYKPGVLYTI